MISDKVDRRVIIADRSGCSYLALISYFLEYWGFKKIQVTILVEQVKNWNDYFETKEKCPFWGGSVNAEPFPMKEMIFNFDEVQVQNRPTHRQLLHTARHIFSSILVQRTGVASTITSLTRNPDQHNFLNVSSFDSSSVSLNPSGTEN